MKKKEGLLPLIKAKDFLSQKEDVSNLSHVK